MTTDFMTFLPSTTAQGAIDKIRERGELETFFYLYVVDEAGRLVGVVPLRNLVVAPPDRFLGDMMIADPIKANVMMDQEEAARLVSKYELLALPIVDESGRLEGIIMVDELSTLSTKRPPKTCIRWRDWRRKIVFSHRFLAR